MSQKRETPIDLLHLFVLSGFALAQPLFDALSKQAEFFVARRSESVDFVLLAFVLSALIPAILAAMELLIGLFGPKLRKGFHSALTALLITIVFLPVLRRVEALPDGIVILVAAATGIGLSYVFTRFRTARSFLTVLSPSILIFPCLFLFHSPVTKLLFSHQEKYTSVETSSTTPVVLVVFDEFCVTSLMNEQGKIDPVRYPNFAAFASDATWFRNATTVSEVTHIVLPAILTGTYPTRHALPLAADYPDNLFTLLAASYDLRVMEPVTELCPDALCEGGWEPQKSDERIESLMLDLSAVYPHLVLPGSLSKYFPSIAHTWGGFLEEEQAEFDARMGNEIKGDRPAKFLKFVETIHDSEKPALYFHHTLLPHAPYDYLPSGKKYAKGSWGYGLLPNSEQWCDSESPVLHAYQRYLLQVGYVDRLIGKLMQRLKDENMYDRSLIVLISDHGVSFIPGDNRRALTETNFRDIMSVVLMIKKPHQTHGQISDRSAESVDILPTIGQVLNVSIPWSVDGQSLFSTSWEPRARKTVFTQANKKYSVDSDLLRKDMALKRQTALFGSGNLTGPFPYLLSSDGLVGRRVEDLSLIGQSDLRVFFENELVLKDFHPAADFAPCHLVATMRSDRVLDHPLRMAVAVNGIIWAEADSSERNDNDAMFSVIVPDSSFRPGFNQVEAFVVAPKQEGLALLRTNVRQNLKFALLRGPEGEKLTCSDGRSFPVVPEAVGGFLDVAEVKAPFVRLSGWAADIKAGELPELIIAFSEGSSMYTIWNNHDRPDVAERFKIPAIEAAGFRFSVPLEDVEDRTVRVFALSKGGIASELNYGEKARWVSDAGKPAKSKGRLSQAGDSHRGASEEVSISDALESTPDPNRPSLSYALVANEQGQAVTCSDGSTLQVMDDAIQGWLDVAEPKARTFRLEGWAAQVDKGKPADTVVVFCEGRSVYAGEPNHARSDVAEHFSNPDLLHSGYVFKLPRVDLKDKDIRVFALSDSGEASELKYSRKVLALLGHDPHPNE